MPGSPGSPELWQGPNMPSAITVRALATSELTAREVLQVRKLLWAAFPPDDDDGFTEDDWDHALGGRHFIGEIEGTIVSHAAVVERELRIGPVALRTGYVEAVATEPGRQGQGLGTAVMQAATDHIRSDYELGALGTGAHPFYERLGWQTWTGRAYVRTDDGRERTPDEEGHIMVLRTPTTPPLQEGAEITCDWRPGDVW
jgi:aminoglycoside 2'-N-acetyltransferase I